MFCMMRVISGGWKAVSTIVCA